jgi:hypothetical protein
VTDLSMGDRFCLWGALIKVLREHNRLKEESAAMFDWQGWTWELREDEFDAICRFLQSIEPQRLQ